jgi:8-oxo-dGTP pyrophosphatase MutT (NUDIX family)
VHIDEIRTRLAALPDPLPPPPRAIDPVILARPADLPEWVLRPQGASSRDAAALVLLYPGIDDEAHVVLTERPSGDLRHPGQVSLPGGASDPGDEFPVGTALREAAEEVGLDPVAAGVEVLGLLETVDVRVSGFMLVPVLAVAARAPALVPDEREVASILHVPVRAFLPDGRIEVVEEDRDGYRIRYGGYPFGGHLIWGATGRILGQLGAVLGRDEVRGSGDGDRSGRR